VVAKDIAKEMANAVNYSSWVLMANPDIVKVVAKDIAKEMENVMNYSSWV